MIDDPLNNSRQAADYLGQSESWLAKKRLDGSGPAYVKIGGSVRYRSSDLKAYVEKSVRRSTHKRDGAGIAAEAAQ